MEIHQLRTFVVVAQERSITRASERLYLSQPAVSAHIKAIEETLDLHLFERTPRGMTLTEDGSRLLLKAEKILAVHREFFEEATRLKGRVAGKLRLGTGGASCSDALVRLLVVLSEQYPDIQVELVYGTSRETLNGIYSNYLDAGFYNEAGEIKDDMQAVEVSRSGIFLAAPVGLVSSKGNLNWDELAELPWVIPTSGTCCGRIAETLFAMHAIRPRRVIGFDHEDAALTLISGGVGIGLLHADTAEDAQSLKGVDLLLEVQTPVRVLFAYQSARSTDPVLRAVRQLLELQHISN